MFQRVDAVFENGVFRPEEPVHIANGERVSLNIESQRASFDDLGDIQDLLDREYMESCQANVQKSLSLEEIRKLTSNFNGSLAEIISQERDER